MIINNDAIVNGSNVPPEFLTLSVVYLLESVYHPDLFLQKHEAQKWDFVSCSKGFDVIISVVSVG